MEPDRRTSSYRNHKWQHAYELVLQEGEDRALFKRIEAAEAAILVRREAVTSFAEEKALADALAHIRFLKRSRLGFDDMREDTDNSRLAVGNTGREAGAQRLHNHGKPQDDFKQVARGRNIFG